MLNKHTDTLHVVMPVLATPRTSDLTEIPSRLAGTPQTIVAREDETVEVGATLAVVGDGSGTSDDTGSGSGDTGSAAPDDATPEPAEQIRPDDAPEQAQGDATDATGEAEQDTGSGTTPATARQAADKAAERQDGGSDSSSGIPDRAEPAAAAKAGTTPYVTPLVRKLAQENGVDLETVEGTGIGGRIRKQDVLAAAEGRGTESAPAAPAQKTAPAGGPSTAGVRPELAELRGTT